MLHHKNPIAVAIQNLLLSALIAFWVLYALIPGDSAFGQSISFEDVSFEAGVQTMSGAHGIAVADYNRDGWDDIFIAAEDGSSALLENQQNGTFADVTQQRGIEISGDALVSVWGDINNDGYLDVFVGKQAGETTCHVLLGSADGTFVDVTERSGIQISDEIGSASFGDFNLDGRIDLFIATRGSEDYLFENINNGGSSLFNDVSARSGTRGDSIALPMQATWVDFDNDYDLDLFAVHDGNRRSRFYQNQSFLPLIEISSSSRLQVARSSMGVAWGDYNNDGWADVYVTNIDKGNLFRNMGNGRFEDVTDESGTGLNGMSWGVVFVDFDNDGDEDLFIGNTYDFDGRRSFLYENREGAFVNIAREAGVALSTNTFGVATGDFNKDGRMDLVVGDDTGGNRLLLNRSGSIGNWVYLTLEGATFNRMGAGATVRVHAEGRMHTRSLHAGSSYRSQVSPTLHIGLAGATNIDSLHIHWGPGEAEVYYDLDVNKDYLLTQNRPLQVHIDDAVQSPKEIEIATFPNPSTNQTTFVISVPAPALTRMEMYDITGRKVETLVDGMLTSGRHHVKFDAEAYPSGIYVYRFINNSTVKTGSIVIAH